MNNPGHRIVCAAIRYQGLVIAGVRHYDKFMQDGITNYFGTKIWPEGWNTTSPSFEQGFLDNRYQFLTREGAWKVAEAAGQIIRRVGGDTINGGTLFSENLY